VPEFPAVSFEYHGEILHQLRLRAIALALRDM
jgi:hypothetical protein